MNALTPSTVNIDSSVHVAVLYGGQSAEREVSLKSGKAVINGLQASQLKVTAIDFDQNGLQQLLDAKPDVVFNILHGRGGEDGEVQGILDYLKIPYTGSQLAASAITMDKLLTKKMLKSENIATPDFMQIKTVTDCELVLEKLGLPLFIKPVVEGSSIGISIVKNRDELIQAFNLAKQYGVVMAEKLIQGKEYTIAFLGEDLLPIIELQTDHAFYDYDAKYVSDDTRYICPCEIDVCLEKEIKNLALKTIECCGVSGWGRIDIMCDAKQAYVIEVNTCPGMTDHSLVPMAAKQIGMDFNALVYRVLQTAYEKETI